MLMGLSVLPKVRLTKNIVIECGREFQSLAKYSSLLTGKCDRKIIIFSKDLTIAGQFLLL